MRPEEYLALQWPDIDFEHGTAMVQRALIRHKKSWTFEEPKTKASRRIVSLPTSLVRKLAAHKDRQSYGCERARSGWTIGWCFAVPSRELSPPKQACRSQCRTSHIVIFARCWKRPSSRTCAFTIYDIRHATLLLIAGEHPKVVSERLGHASIRITMDTYSHVLRSMQKRTATQLEKTFYGERKSARTSRK